MASNAEEKAAKRAAMNADLAKRKAQAEKAVTTTTGFLSGAVSKIRAEIGRAHV